MDLITQGLLGAAIGQAFFTHKLGRRAVWVGALAGMFPDIDMVAVILGGPLAEFKYHRSITHSFWFGALLAPFLSLYASDRWGPKYDLDFDFWPWFWLFFWALFTHPLLDLFTVYGTQFWAPLSLQRLHCNAIAIVDLIYSAILILALILGAVFDRRNRQLYGQNIAKTALLVTTLYLFLGAYIDNFVTNLGRQSKPHHLIKAHPTLLQLFYRKIYAYGRDEICVSFFSVLEPKPLKFKCYPQVYDKRVLSLLATEMGGMFQWFTDEEIYIERSDKEPNLIRLHDVRFALPSKPFEGITGIHALVDAKGVVLNEPQRFTNRTLMTEILKKPFWNNLAQQLQKPDFED